MLKMLGLMLWKLFSLLFFAWTTPRTWVDTELVDAAMMNTHVRDNLNALLNRPVASVADATQYTTTSSSFVEVDAGFRLTITPQTSSIIVSFIGVCKVADPDNVQMHFDIDVNGVSPSGNGGVAAAQQSRATAVAFSVRVTGLTAGVSHTIKLMWKQTNDGSYTSLTCTLGGSITGYGGASQRTFFSVREA